MRDKADLFRRGQKTDSLRMLTPSRLVESTPSNWLFGSNRISSKSTIQSEAFSLRNCEKENKEKLYSLVRHWSYRTRQCTPLDTGPRTRQCISSDTGSLWGRRCIHRTPSGTQGLGSPEFYCLQLFVLCLLFTHLLSVWAKNTQERTTT